MRITSFETWAAKWDSNHYPGDVTLSKHFKAAFEAGRRLGRREMREIDDPKHDPKGTFFVLEARPGGTFKPAGWCQLDQSPTRYRTRAIAQRAIDIYVSNLKRVGLTPNRFAIGRINRKK